MATTSEKVKTISKMTHQEREALSVSARYVTEPAKEFLKDSKYWIRKAEAPPMDDYFKILKSVGVGFVIMGFVGFVVKMFFEPVKNAIAGIPS